MPALLGLDAGRLAGDRTRLGGLLENLILMEVVKQSGWSTVKPGLFHFRSHDGRKVDLVLEAPNGRVVGVEVKAASGAAGDSVRLGALRGAARRGLGLGRTVGVTRSPVSWSAPPDRKAHLATQPRSRFAVAQPRRRPTTDGGSTARYFRMSPAPGPMSTAPSQAEDPIPVTAEVPFAVTARCPASPSRRLPSSLRNPRATGRITHARRVRTRTLRKVETTRWPLRRQAVGCHDGIATSRRRLADLDPAACV